MQAASLTLPRFYTDVFRLTYLTGAAVTTLDAYTNTLNHWQRLIGDLTLPAIDVPTLAKFKEGLFKTQAAATVNKNLRHVQHLLNKLGPPGPRNRDALGWLNRVPWIKPLREEERDVQTVEFSDFDRLYHAAQQARLPNFGNEISTRDWWQALLTLAYTSALRRGTLLALKWSHVDLRAGLLKYDGSSDKAKRRRAKPLHSMAIEALLRIRHVGELVFAWRWSMPRYHMHWRALCKLAGLVDATGKPLVHGHDFKRTALSQASGVADVFAVSAFGDHSSVNVTERYYVNAASRLAPLVHALPLPPCLQGNPYVLTHQA